MADGAGHSVDSVLKSILEQSPYSCKTAEQEYKANHMHLVVLLRHLKNQMDLYTGIKGN
jgi:hypothetical protein